MIACERCGVEVNVPALIDCDFRRNKGMQVSLRVLLMANTLYSVAFKAAGQVVSVTRLNCRLTGGL